MKVDAFYILREIRLYALLIPPLFTGASSKRRADLASKINLYSVHFPHNVDPINDPEKHEHSFAERLANRHVSSFSSTPVDFRSTFCGIRSFEKVSGGAYTSQVRFSRGYKRGNKLRTWFVREKFKLSQTRIKNVPALFRSVHLHIILTGSNSVRLW